jgi:hypothetical protein
MTFTTLSFGLLTFALLLMVLGWAADLFHALHRNTAPRVTSTRARSTAGTSRASVDSRSLRAFGGGEKTGPSPSSGGNRGANTM